MSNHVHDNLLGQLPPALLYLLIGLLIQLAQGSGFVDVDLQNKTLKAGYSGKSASAETLVPATDVQVEPPNLEPPK